MKDIKKNDLKSKLFENLMIRYKLISIVSMSFSDLIDV